MYYYAFLAGLGGLLYSKKTAKEGMTEGETSLQEQPLQLSERDITDLWKCLLPVACKGFVVGAGLHVGQVLIGGVVSRKLFKE